MPEKFTDTIIRALVRFFKAEWSGAFVAILILALAIEFSTSGRPFFIQQIL